MTPRNPVTGKRLPEGWPDRDPCGLHWDYFATVDQYLARTWPRYAVEMWRWGWA